MPNKPSHIHLHQGLSINPTSLQRCTGFDRVYHHSPWYLGGRCWSELSRPPMGFYQNTEKVKKLRNNCGLEPPQAAQIPSENTRVQSDLRSVTSQIQLSHRSQRLIISLEFSADKAPREWLPIMELSGLLRLVGLQGLMAVISPGLELVVHQKTELWGAGAP